MNKLLYRDGKGTKKSEKGKGEKRKMSGSVKINRIL